MLKFFASSRPRSSGGGDSAGAAAGALPPLRAAIVGAGTVGGGVLKLLRQHADLIAARCGRRIEPCAIVARDLKKARDRLHSENAAMLGSDWKQAAAHPKADVVVELMGGENEAGECILLALQNGKAVVTANKALLAAKGDEIFAAARQADKPVAFEAAIAGCIPIIKTLREALAADDVGEAAGIINGTCNHILTAMSGRGLSFESALAESQRLGYAEADPSLDIDGIDAAHKIALIARLAFNARPKMGDFPIKGVRDFDLRDIRHAAGMGFCIKLLAQARREKNGAHLSVEPTLVSESHPLAAVNGAMNAIALRSAFAGETMYYGAGAGGDATAAAVVADLIDIARGNNALQMQDGGESPPLLSPESFCAPHFLRLSAIDRPGVLAEITRELAAEDISIEAIRQQESNPGREVDIILLLHDAARGRVQAAAKRIEEQQAVAGKIAVLPMMRAAEQ